MTSSCQDDCLSQAIGDQQACHELITRPTCQRRSSISRHELKVSQRPEEAKVLLGNHGQVFMHDLGSIHLRLVVQLTPHCTQRLNNLRSNHIANRRVPIHDTTRVLPNSRSCDQEHMRMTRMVSFQVCVPIASPDMALLSFGWFRP